MPGVDFENLFHKADNLRNNALVDEAVAAYKEIAGLVTQPEELPYQARAWQMAGVSSSEAIMDEGSYYRDAQTYFDQAEKLFRQLNDQIGLGSLQRDRAISAEKAGRSSLAEEWFQKSLVTLSATSSPTELGISQVKFGLHLYRLNDYSTAEKQITIGLKLLEEEPAAGFYHATALYDLARVKLKLGAISESLELARISLSWFEADHDNHSYQRRLAQLHGLLFVLYFRQNDKKLAKRHGEAYQKLLQDFDPLAAKVLERDLEIMATAA